MPPAPAVVGDTPTHRPRISVVIPTTGRASLQSAVASALRQTESVALVVVAVDGPTELVGDLPPDARVRVVSATGFGRGGNAARVAGMAQVQDGLVALLDDDDVWDPRKLAVQLERYLEVHRSGGPAVVVACRVREVGPDGGAIGIVPRSILRSGQSVAEYLFDRTSVRRPSGHLNSSMLLFDRELARTVPFDTSLPRHQDWDWLLRVDAAGAARFEMVPEVLLDYLVSPPGASVSSARGWLDSARWVRAQGGLLTGRQRSELLLSVTVPIALKHGEWAAAGRLVVEAAGLGPRWQSLAFSFAHVPLVVWRRLNPTRRPGAGPRRRRVSRDTVDHVS